MGTVNIFLGGSGKYVAEVLKGTSAYYSTTMPPVIAFDLETTATHTGAFSLGSELATVDGGTFPAYAKGTVAQRWSQLDAGQGLTPKPGRGGPSQPPEVSVMRRIGHDVLHQPAPGTGLWGLRGPGLLALDAFMDPTAPGQGPALAAGFQQRVANELQVQGAGGDTVRVNIVASTAGGTGAGTFLPLALWLSDLAASAGVNVPVKLSLILFSWSTFSNEPFGDAQARTEVLSKGQSGTFAILRELQMLYSYAHDATRLPARRFPLTFRPLPYRLSSDPFEMVFWVGHRATQPQARKSDVYDEGSRLAQILSHEQVAAALAGATGEFKERMILSVASVDYLKLHIAQRLSGDLVATAIEKLLGSTGDVGGRDELSDMWGQNPPPFGVFLRSEKDNALERPHSSDASAAALDRSARPRNVDALVDPHAPDIASRRLVKRGHDRLDGAYAVEPEHWVSYCVGLKKDLVYLAESHLNETRKVVDRQMADAVAECKRWLNEDVVRLKLDPPEEERQPASLVSVRRTLDGIALDLQAVKTFFDDSKGVGQRVPQSSDLRFKPLAQIQEQIDHQDNRLLRPGGDSPEKLSTAKRVMLAFASLGFLVMAWLVLGLLMDAGLGRVLAAVVVAAVLGYILYRMLKRSVTRIEVLRRRAEDELFGLYRDLLYAQAAAAMFSGVSDTFAPNAIPAVESARKQLDNLEGVYKELQGRARGRVAAAATPPLHSVDQVGMVAQLPAYQTSTLSEQLTRAIRVRIASGASLPDATLSVNATAPVAAYSASVNLMASALADQQRANRLGTLPGEPELDTIDRTLDEMGMLVLGGFLPADLADAIERAAGADPVDQKNLVRDLLSKLMHRDGAGRLLPGPDVRLPSIACKADGARVRMLLVPDVNVQAMVNGARAALPAPTATEFNAFLNLAGGNPFIAGNIGPSIMALSLWDPRDLLATGEATLARDTYYGTGPMGAAAGAKSQRVLNFQVLPEVAAAAAIELSEATISPLHPAIVARLLGSDPDSGGPTLLDLFYLLLAQNVLVEEADSPGPNRLRRWVLSLPARDKLSLFSEPFVAAATPLDPFGNGRPIVNAFDAFAEFMLYDGRQIGGGPGGLDAFVTLPAGARLDVNAWAQLGPVGMGDSQGALLTLWHSPDSAAQAKSERDSILSLAKQHSRLMNGVEPDGSPNQIGADWLRAVTMLAESGYQKRIGLADGRELPPN